MKKFCSLLLCVCLLLTLPLSALAAQETKMIQAMWIDDREMTLVCADGTDSAGTYQVLLDGQELPVEESNVREEELPVTVFCLVDTSGSTNEFKMRILQETLMELSNSLGADDNMVIATLSNSLEIGPLLKTKQEREVAIEAITATHEDTNLYAGIVQSLEKLTSDESYNPYGCLVVLSDGQDHQDNGMTEQEVMNAIKAARLPVYTVALIATIDERDGGKVLGSFSRTSCGGMHLTTVSEGANKPIRWDMTGDEFGSLIWTSMQGMTVLNAGLYDVALDGQKSEIQLDVVYTSGSDVYTDAVILEMQDLAHLIPVPETTEAPVNWFVAMLKKPLFWVAVAAVLVLTGVVILLIIQKKPKKQEEPQNMDAPFPVSPLQDVGMTQNFDNDKPVDRPVESPVVFAPPAAPKKQYKVFMTDIPYGKFRLNFMVNADETVLFGRDPNRVQHVISTSDTQLSGKHFAMMLKDEYFCIRDEASKNGTFVNGVTIANAGWVKIQNGDKIRVGAYEYRITIES